MISLARQAGRAFRRAPLLLLACLAAPSGAAAQDDAAPTWWHEAAGLTPLLTAPPPPNPATICVIDTGVTPTPDLDITARWAYDGGTLDDVHATPESPGHGTLVAHFAAGAVNGWGGAGAFPHGRISSVRVFPRVGGASWREYIAAISRCLKLDANTKVIVISIGGQDIEPGEADELEHWIGRARDRNGINVVVAAGNGGGPPDFPGRFSAAFTVAAIAEDGALCGFSSRGGGVDLAAPGCTLLQAGWDGRLWSTSGTSYAAPIVGGVLAALRSHDPSLSPGDAEAVLTASSRGGDPPILDAQAALHAAGVSEVGAVPASNHREANVPVHGEAAVLPALVLDRRGVTSRQLPRPAVRIRKRSGDVALVARNRPRGARFDVRLGRRVFRRLADRVRLPTSARSARCRFVSELSASRWTTVRW